MPNIEKINKILNDDRYVLIDQGFSSFTTAPYWRYINKETFKFVIVNEEEINDEEFFSIFGIEEDDLIEQLQKKLGKKDLTEVMDDNSYKWDNEVFKDFVKEIIKENEQVLKVVKDI